MSNYSRDGEILEELLNELGFKKAELARRLDKHINSIRYMMENNIPNDVLIEIGRILRYDMSAKFPRLRDYQPAKELSYFNEDPAPFLKRLDTIEKQIVEKEQTIADTRSEIKYLQGKIVDLQQLIDAKNESLQDKNLIIDQLQKEIEKLKSGPKKNGDAA